MKGIRNQKVKHGKTKQLLTLVLLTSVLVTLLTSCGTTRKVEISLPQIDFPSFPIVLDENATIEYTDETKSTVIIKSPKYDDVIISSWFFMALVDYDIEVQLAYEKYEYLKEHTDGTFQK